MYEKYMHFTNHPNKYLIISGFSSKEGNILAFHFKLCKR